MKINIIFYEDCKPEDCDILAACHYKNDAKKWLENHGWKFDASYCVWHHPSYRGFVEILEKDLQ